MYAYSVDDRFGRKKMSISMVRLTFSFFQKCFFLPAAGEGI